MCDSCAVISTFWVFFVAPFNGQGKCRCNRANGKQNLLSLVEIGLKGFWKFMTAVAPVTPVVTSLNGHLPFWFCYLDSSRRNRNHGQNDRKIAQGAVVPFEQPLMIYNDQYFSMTNNISEDWFYFKSYIYLCFTSIKTIPGKPSPPSPPP